MANMNNNYLKLAVQKEGRLTAETLSFLRASGIEFESYRQKLFSTARNFPLEIIYVRDDDIGDYVATGAVDIGIIGQNLLYEDRPRVKKLLNLRFGFCSLMLAVPKDSPVTTLSQLEGKTIATSYPNSTRNYFAKNNISVNIIKISGSVEIAPSLGVADATADLMSTGSTLTLNDLRPLSKIYESESVLIANAENTTESAKKEILEKLLIRFKSVLSAKNYKYVLLTVPEMKLSKIRKIITGTALQSITRAFRAGWITVSSVMKEDIVWESVGKLQAAGARQITVLPVEKIINLKKESI